MPNDGHAALYDLHLASPPCSRGDQLVRKLGMSSRPVRQFPARGSGRCGSRVSAASVDLCTVLCGSAGAALGTFALGSYAIIASANDAAWLADAASVVAWHDSVTGNGWRSG